MLGDTFPAGASAQSFTKRAPARADALCRSRQAFPDANERIVGNTTYLNRQLSVYEVLCTDFGRAPEAFPTGDVFCTLYAAAVGVKFKLDELYIEGACAATSIVRHENTAGIICGGFLDLIGAVATLAPELKAYAVAAGVACDIGHSLGSWIETRQEAKAAKAVWQRGRSALKPGKCLKFVHHGFPRGDDWLATPCAKTDRGFEDLQRASGPRSCPSFTVNRDYGGGEVISYVFYNVHETNTTCATVRQVITDYLYGRGHPLGPSPTDGASVDGWNTLVLSAHADGHRGRASFTASYR